MDFSAVASFFNDDPVYDAFTDELLFHCHSKAATDQTSAGATIRRRSMTTEVDVTAPARQTIRLLGEPWLVGNSTVDSFQGESIRRIWDIKRGTSTMYMMTPAQACAGIAGTLFYAQRELYQDAGNPRSYSDWDPMWGISVTPFDGAGARGKFVREGSTLFRIRGLYAEVNGLIVLEADEFDSDAMQQAIFTLSGVPDIITDKLTTTTVTLPVIQSDSMKFFKYRTQAEADTQPGDRVVFVSAASAAPQPGAQLAMLGATWRVLSSIIDGDARVLRVRLV